ncbi:MAG: aminotransferase class I/II-fold pyridoxal phosphate-dependent enzyme [Clostridia bacterium]|nr:aminotransferase class I/II-fold pyridoxal phosphate-dependent enzyme [Clostridia bacterium]
MDRILYDTILNMNENCKARFCMPAHAGAGTSDSIYASAGFDWTEVPRLDNLLNSENTIKYCEESIAQSMGYASALMLTQGSTCGMHIAVCVCKDRGESLIAVGDMHKSFFSACRLYGAKALRVQCASDLDNLDRSLQIGGIFITSPDYFGKCQDLLAVRKFADKLGVCLVVDEAHASHFAYSSLLPDNAKEYADISLMSMHKTLPVYGGGAIVCLKDKALRLDCERYRAMIHSTSPNYLIMASMDYANSYMSKNGEKDYARVKQKIDEFTQNLKVGEVVRNDDFTRLVIKIDGKDAYKALLDLAKKGVYVEMAKDDLLVCIITPFNCDLLNILADELNNMQFVDLGEEKKAEDVKCVSIANTHSDIEYVDLDNCIGRISAEDVGVYPPGTPVVLKGEVIDENAVKYLKKYPNRLFGLAHGRIAVIK